MPVRAGNDVKGRPAMTVFVMPDVIGHLLLPQGRLPVGAGNDVKVGAGNDVKSRPAMT